MSDLIVKEVPDLVKVASALDVTDKTRETYENAMKSYHRYCMEQDVEQDLDSLRAWIKSARTPATQAMWTAASKKVFSQLFRGRPELSDLRESLDSIKKVKRDLTVTESRYLTAEEVDKLVAISPEHLGLMIRTLFMTGLRISELLNIKLSDCVSIRDGKAYEIQVLGKGRKPYKGYINQDLYLDINNKFKGKKYLFEHDGSTYSRHYIAEALTKLGHKIGKKISPHTLRHSFANYHLANGMSIEKVSAAMNHKSIQTTNDFYGHQKPTLEELRIIK